MRLMVFCGPCVIEGEDFALQTAEILAQIADKIGVDFVYKSSYDKANRASVKSYRGPGVKEGLRILRRVQKECGLPILTDVHSPEEAALAGEFCEYIQIPAFLSRQTDLLVAAAQTKATVCIKKGQFLSPWDMTHVVEKLTSCGKHSIILTERGASFGYNNLVTDMRAIPIMQKLGFPVCFDATHSLQLPGGNGKTSGGQREYSLHLARAALAAGADSLFCEAHPNPDCALCDASTQIPFSELEDYLRQCKAVFELVQSFHGSCVHGSCV